MIFSAQVKIAVKLDVCNRLRGKLEQTRQFFPNICYESSYKQYILSMSTTRFPFNRNLVKCGNIEIVTLESKKLVRKSIGNIAKVKWF